MGDVVNIPPKKARHHTSHIIASLFTGCTFQRMFLVFSPMANICCLL
jgi:hypothetical protein